MVTNDNMMMDLLKELTMKSRNFKTPGHKGVFRLFGCISLDPRSRGILVLTASAALFGAGCGGNQPRDPDATRYYTDQSRAVFAPDASVSAPPPGADGQGDAGSASVDTLPGWSIALTRVEQGGMEQAARMLQRVQEQGGLSGAYIDERNTGLVIAYGNYVGRDDPQARKDLERIRSIEVLGTKPFRGAIIVPPTGEDLMGSNPAWDLRTVKQRYGKGAIYTLQVGVYGRSDYQTPSPEELALFRRAAESAVRDLRSKGETAFYYHSPARSMVTVGVFGEKDFDSTTMPAYQSPALEATRERFPNNLLNGAGISETIRIESGKVTRLQSSQLVAIPDP